MPSSKLKVGDEGKRHGEGSSCGLVLVRVGARASAGGRRPVAGREGPRQASACMCCGAGSERRKPRRAACIVECGERLAWHAVRAANAVGMQCARRMPCALHCAVSSVSDPVVLGKR